MVLTAMLLFKLKDMIRELKEEVTSKDSLTDIKYLIAVLIEKTNEQTKEINRLKKYIDRYTNIDDVNQNHL